MKHFANICIFLSVFLSSNLLALVDRTDCDDSAENFLPLSDTTGGTKAFLKICLPSDRENGTNTVDGMVNANIRGGLLQIGNQVLCAMDEDISTSECIDPDSKEYFYADGTTNGCANSGSDDGCQNNDFGGGPDNEYLGLADYDDNITYGVSAAQAATTTNSTMARLSLSTNDEVIWAKLYWMGRTDSSGDADYPNVKDVKLMTPTTGGVYQDIECSHYGDSGDEYYCSAEVTQLVSQSGQYWVGNVDGHEFSSNNFAAWSLSVVYKNNASPFTNIAIYEGFGRFSSGSTPLTIPVSGFLTPSVGDVNATFHVLAGESDNGYNDQVTASNSSGSHVVVNPVGPDTDFLNATISRFGIIEQNRLPNFSNSLGIDIDSVGLDTLVGGVPTPILENNQSSSSLVFTSSQDELFIPVVSFTTEIYQPKLCYDYSYYQNNRFFTEDNNGSLNVQPSIVGDVIPGDPIRVRILVKNLEENSFASDLTMTVQGLSAGGQAVYDNNLTLTEPNGAAYLPATPISSSDDHTKYLMTDALGNQERVFSEFTIDPSSSSLNIPLDMSVDFSITLSGGITIDYRDFELKNEVPLCTTANFAYQPEWGTFNVEDSAARALADSTGAPRKYNLLTQVAGRPFNIDVTTYEASDYNLPKSGIQTMVAVDLIDMRESHDANESCYDPATLTGRVWVPIVNNGDTHTTVDFNQAVLDGDIPNLDAFFAHSRENVSVRVSMTVGNDQNNSLIDWSIRTSNPQIGSVEIHNFPDVIQAYGPACQRPVTTTAGGSGTTHIATTVSDACGNSGVSGLSLAQFKKCQECIFGSNTRSICSRDNFTIRPEGLFTRIYDNNQSTDVLNPRNEVSEVGNISAGYLYRYDVNATSHTDEKGIEGYSISFRGGATTDPDHNATYHWAPDGHDTTNCNDTSDKYVSLSLANGIALNNQAASDNVGRYELKIKDNSWSKVDQSPEHHVGSHYNLDDCVPGESFVPATATAITSTNIGCDISSEHTNVDRPGIDYYDYKMTSRPYAFNLSAVTFNRGMVDRNISITPANAFVYNNNILGDDYNMSARYTGRLRAVGFTQTSLSNFVQNCWSNDVNLTFNTDITTLSPAPAVTTTYSTRLVQRDETGAIFRDDIQNTNGGGNDEIAPVIHPADDFLQLLGGEAEIELNGNFGRATDVPINPIDLNYVEFHVGCSDLNECDTNADLEVPHYPEGTVASNQSVKHVYGRVHTPRQRSATQIATVPTSYEFYCDSTTGCVIGNHTLISPLQLLSPDDIRWYNLAIHTTTDDGFVTSTQTRNGVDNGAFSAFLPAADGFSASYTYTSFATNLPYKTTIQLNTQNWLIYERYNAAATFNTFELEYFGIGNRAGTGTTTTDSNAATNTSRRIQW